MRAFIKRGAALLLLWTGAAAQESQLGSLSQTLSSLRRYAGSNSSVRGGLPELTIAKHQLREWIESRLVSFPQNGDEGALSNDFLDAIQKAKLFCDDPSDCTPNPLGFLDQIQIKREHGLLVITTAVGTGIRCGYDYSAYIYAWERERWRRVWENEQNEYAENAYHPQTLHSVHVSDAAGEGARLILTLGTPAGCTGAFVPLYYRLWRSGPGGAVASLILDKSETLNEESEPPAIAKLTPNDLLIEFSAGGTGYGNTHKALRHYEIQGGRATQTDPIAPTPRDFVEEWLGAPWPVSASRSGSQALREWHTKLHREDGQGDYPEPALSCGGDPALVEIATHLEGLPKHYFLVRTNSALHFTMAGVGDLPFPGCNQPDPAADQQPSLIPANN